MRGLLREEAPVSARTLLLYPVLLSLGIGTGLLVQSLGCNSYDLLVYQRFLQASFSNRVDILWLVDNSQSMLDNQDNLRTNFACFINELSGVVDKDQPCKVASDCPTDDAGVYYACACGFCESPPDAGKLETISDALLLYEDFLGDPTKFLNYQMGITTTQSRPCADDPTAFADCIDSVGNTGRLRGLGNTGNDTSHAPTFLTPDTEDLAADFSALVDVGIDGATEEYGLWVVAETICASLDLQKDSDFDPTNGIDTMLDCDHEDGEPYGDPWQDTDTLYDFCSCFPQSIYDYNIDGAGTRFMRDSSTLVVILVSDEGDYTPNMGTDTWPWPIDDCVIDDPWPLEVQDACQDAPTVSCENYCKIDFFLDFFAALDRRVVFAIIGPGAELKTDQLGNITTDVFCNDQNSSVAMLEFYLWASELTGGLYAPVDVLADGNEHECTDADFADVLADLGKLVSNLAREWPLNRVPDVDTLMVFVDGEEIPPAECLPGDDECVPSGYHPACTDDPSAGMNGWAYDPSTQSLRFHGDCIPDFNQVVDVYYLPQSGSGRPLPF